MKNLTPAIFLMLSCGLLLAQDQKRPIQIDDYFSIQSVGDPQISPDGHWVAYTVASNGTFRTCERFADFLACQRS